MEGDQLGGSRNSGSRARRIEGFGRVVGGSMRVPGLPAEETPREVARGSVSGFLSVLPYILLLSCSTLIQQSIILFRSMSSSGDGEISSQASQKTHELVARISQSLLQRLSLMGKDKLSSEQSFSSEDANLLKALPRDSDHYDIINSLLTCEMIIKELFADADWAEKIVMSAYENMTHVLENFTLLQRALQGKDRNLIIKALSYSYDHMDSMTATLHTFPVCLRNASRKSAFVEQHLGIIQQAREALATPIPQQQSSSATLTQQLQLENKQLSAANLQLKESLNKAEKELMQLQIKLVNLLNDREFSQDNQSEDLKEELAKARMDIDRMDEEFRVEINKYNEVFRSMENEIRSLRDYQNVDVVEELETEIVRLREERERDDIIIHEMKERERELVKELNRGAGSYGYQSPRANARFKQYPVT